MMKILHTSDLHLLKEGDERWDALQKVIQLGRHHDVDVLAISGDLFDSNLAGEELRVALRDVFGETGFRTLIIPGNHDAGAYARGLYFGDQVKIFRENEWAENSFESGDVRIIGIPFERLSPAGFLEKLSALCSMLDESRCNILMYHGELLDVSFERDAFGAEDARYMPSRLSFFDKPGVDYVLAGHFHINSNIKQMSGERYFIYPGSPVSITKRETGKRQVVLVEPGKPPAQIYLDTHHYQAMDVSLNAFLQDDPIEKVNQALEKLDPSAAALLTVRGTISGSEEALTKEIAQMLEGIRAEQLRFEFRDVSRVLGHPVFRKIEEHLESMMGDPEFPLEPDRAEALRDLFLQAMSGVEL